MSEKISLDSSDIIYETLQVTRLFLTLDSLRRSKHIKNNVKFKM